MRNQKYNKKDTVMDPTFNAFAFLTLKNTTQYYGTDVNRGVSLSNDTPPGPTPDSNQLLSLVANTFHLFRDEDKRIHGANFFSNRLHKNVQAKVILHVPVPTQPTVQSLKEWLDVNFMGKLHDKFQLWYLNEARGFHIYMSPFFTRFSDDNKYIGIFAAYSFAPKPLTNMGAVALLHAQKRKRDDYDKDDDQDTDYYKCVTEINNTAKLTPEGQFMEAIIKKLRPLFPNTSSIVWSGSDNFNEIDMTRVCGEHTFVAVYSDVVSREKLFNNFQSSLNTFVALLFMEISTKFNDRSAIEMIYLRSIVEMTDHKLEMGWMVKVRE